MVALLSVQHEKQRAPKTHVGVNVNNMTIKEILTDILVLLLICLMAFLMMFL